MAKFWFVSAPLFSHLDWGGYLKTAQALIRRGHEVTWVSENTLGGALAAAGVPFAPIRVTGWLWPPPPAPDLTTIPPQEAVMLRYRRALDTWLSEDLVGDAVQALIDLADEIGTPDAIVTDPFLTAAALAAEALDIPLAVCGWVAQKELNEDFLFPVQKSLGDESRGRIERLCARFGLRGVNIAPGPTPSILSPHLHVSYFSPSWYEADSANLLPQTLFVGGAPTPPSGNPPDWLTGIPTVAPIALITLGTTFTGDHGFFSWAAQAAARAGFVPLVVVGWNPIEPEEKGRLIAALPPGTRLLNFVPFDHVLPRTKLMIHHGGMGTTHAALIHAIPQIVVPHAADQRGQARRVAQAKVGLNLTAHDVKQGMLLEGVKAIVSDEKVKQTARELAAEMAALGGAERAAEAVAGIVTSA
ncbi:MAG: glycosyltransferase family 1 protein [Anaerolineae bacterium]|nr:glycosyltransferase family 1 protein [Anaerolineae bacterium]